MVLIVFRDVVLIVLKIFVIMLLDIVLMDVWLDFMVICVIVFVLYVW